MTRTMTGMLIVVLAMASSAHAVFNENFESYNVGDDVRSNGSGWGSRAFDNYGKEKYVGAQIVVDTGTNGTQVGDLVDASAWGTPYYNLDPADQFSSGVVTFDMLNDGGGSRTWFNDSHTASGFSTGGGLWVMNLSWTSGTEIFERLPGGNLWDEIPSGNRATSPAFTSGQWHTYTIDFDFNGGTGGNGEWSLSVDGSPTLSGALTSDGTSAGRSLKGIGWGVASGGGPLLDNIRIVPEPATCMLFAGGLLCLLRRRA